MSHKFTVLAMMAAVLAAGCTGDGLAGGAAGTDAGTGATAYVTLTFTMPSDGGTRATGGETGDGQEAGQDAENTIRSAVAFFYKESSEGEGVNSCAETPIVKVVEFDALTSGTSESGGTSGNDVHNIDREYSVTQEVDGIEYGTYNLIVAANLSENDNSGWWNNANLTLGAVRDHIIKSAWQENEDGYSDFLMTSGSDASVILSPRNSTSATAAQAVVSVERVAARVDYMTTGCNNYTCDGDAAIRGSVTITGAAIVNDYAAGSYLLKRVADDVSGTDPDYLGDEIACEKKTNYVLDPLTCQKTESASSFTLPGGTGSALSHKDLFRQGSYYCDGDNSQNPAFWDEYVDAGKNTQLDEVDGETWTRVGYTLENTTPGGDCHAPEKYYNTGVVFKAKFTPADGTVNNDFSKVTYTAGQTFFRLGDMLFATMEDMTYYMFTMTGCGVSFCDVYKSLSCSTWDDVCALAAKIEPVDPSGYGKWLLSACGSEDPGNSENAESERDKDNLTDDDKTKLSWASYMKTVCGYSFECGSGVTLNQDSIITREVLSRASDYGVGTYQDATCYYTWWLEHNSRSDGNGTEGVMEHAVVRNNIYKLKVTGVYSLGGDVPGESRSLRVQVTVNDWRLLRGETVHM